MSAPVFAQPANPGDPAQPPPAPPPQTAPAQPPPAPPPLAPAPPPAAQPYPYQYPQQQYPQQQYPQQQYPQQPYPYQYPQQQYPQQPYPQQPYPPPAIAPPPAPQVEVKEPPLPSERAPRNVPLSVFRLGYGAYADGTLSFEGQCAGSCPLSLRNSSSDVDDHTPVLLGFDLMFGPEPVSLGLGFWFTTGTTLEGSDLAVGERSIGWEFATPFMLGAAVPVSEGVAVRLGAFAGPEFLFADDDTAQGRDGDAYENLCDDFLSTGRVSECDVSSPTRFSWTYGFQAGPVFRTSRYNTVGAELVLQRIDLRLFSVDAEASSWRAKQTYDYGAWRFWIMVTAGVGK